MLDIASHGYGKAGFAERGIEHRRNVWNGEQQKRVKPQCIKPLTVQGGIQGALPATGWAIISRKKAEGALGCEKRLCRVDIVVDDNTDTGANR